MRKGFLAVFSGFPDHHFSEYGQNDDDSDGMHEMFAGQASDPVIGTGCDHIVIPEPIRSEFFRGLKDAVLEAGDRIVFNDTYVLYLTKKPC